MKLVQFIVSDDEAAEIQSVWEAGWPITIETENPDYFVTINAIAAGIDGPVKELED